MTLEDKLKTVIRDVPDFPKPGILFKDISTIMLDPKMSKETLEYLRQLYQDKPIDAIAGIESRGFLFGYPLAMALDVPFILIRKKGNCHIRKLAIHMISNMEVQLLRCMKMLFSVDKMY